MAQLPVGNTDSDLLEGARKGDEHAFLALYRRMYPPIYRFALQMSGSLSLADDVTQEVFLTLLREEFGYDSARGSLSSYLYGVARHLVLRHLERDRSGVSLDGDDEPALELAAPEPDALTHLTRLEDIEAVRAAVLALPPRYREVIILCDLQEMEYAEAAQALACALGTVRSRLHRARALLLEKLTRGKQGDSIVDSLRPLRCLS